MATGLVAALGVSSTVTYVPDNDAKLTISSFCNSGSLTMTIGGVSMSSTSTIFEFHIFVAGGSSITLATGTNTYAAISTLES